MRSSGCAYHVRDEKSTAARVRSSGCSYHVRNEKSTAARVLSSGCSYHVRNDKASLRACGRAGVFIMCVTKKALLRACGRAGVLLMCVTTKHCCARAVERAHLPTSARGAWRFEGPAPDHELKPENKQTPQSCRQQKSYKHRGRLRRRHQKPVPNLAPMETKTNTCAF